MNTKYITLGIFAVILSANCGYAQKFDIKRLSTNEGLPAGQIGYVTQDPEGYIWMSSYYGLIRYDGIDIKTYTTENGLRNNLVYHLYVDNSGRMWVSNENAGVGYMEGDSVYYPTKFAPLDSLTVTYMTQSEDGRFWFSTYSSGVFIWDGSGFEHINQENGLPSNIAWHIRFDESGEAWIGTQSGLAIYDGDTTRVVDESNGLSGSAAYTFAEAANGDIWISTSSGITVYDGKQWNHITSINGKQLGYIYDVFVDREGLVWIATERFGIYWFDGEHFTHIGKQNGLSSDYIYTFNEDNKGRVWIATDENGVNIFRNKNIRIYNGPDYVRGESVNILFEQGETMWVGTEEGITRFREEGKSEHYQLPDSIASYKEIWDIDELPNGNLLVMNSNSRLYEFDGYKFTDYGKQHEIPWVYLHDLLVDGNTIWLAAESGLLKYHDGEVKTYTEKDGLVDNFISSLYRDHEGYIWAVTELGINKIIMPDSIVSFSFQDGIAGSSMTLLTQSPDHNYWIGTNQGFTQLAMDEMNKPVQISNFQLAEEFLSEAQFLQFDKEGNLWMGTSGGIHFFDNEQLNNSDGGGINGIFMPLQDYGKGMEMNYLASLQDQSGNMWFGSFENGLIKYEAGQKPVLKESPEPFVKQVVINGQVFDKKILNTKSLKHYQNDISIQFGAFNYKYPERVYYEYKLEGFEDSWHKEYAENEATYTNLPPGEYAFKLRAKSIDSEWGSASTLAAFRVAKPYWQTSWFYLLMLLVGLGFIAGLIKILLGHFEKEKLSSMVDERTKELKKTLGEKDVLIKEIHHRVKNNLAVVSGLLDLQGWKIKDKQAKMAIQNSKLRIQTMSSIHEKLYQNEDLTNIEFGKFAEDLINKISSSLKGSSRDIKVEIDIESVELDIHAAIPCGLILNEAVSNSFEHAFNTTKEGNIFVSFKEVDDEFFELKVQDDGDGTPQKIIDGERSSLGITLINSLAEQIKGNAHIHNNNGTTVTVLIPKSI